MTKTLPIARAKREGTSRRATGTTRARQRKPGGSQWRKSGARSQPREVARVLTGSSPDIRWSPGERLETLFEARCDELGKKAPAVIQNGKTCSFRDLDGRANQLARLLIKRGVKPGDRVGVLCERGMDTYIALLAVLKVRAAYVPLDKSFPDERIAFILKDAGVRTIVSLSIFSERLKSVPQTVIFTDLLHKTISRQSRRRPKVKRGTAASDELCYIIYTSGTTGNPKGVAIDHASICNFVRVAAEVYGIAEGDRVFQGMTIAFDFSVEELWVPLLAGATLVPAPPDSTLIGEELASFLRDNDISVLCCVPTLLATLECDLPKLRILLVSGEACPQNLVDRWHRPGRRILNAYGPTEATVTATLTELYPNKPVTIGKPLPTYTIVILDEAENALVPSGKTGEIGIAGIGLARGYLNRDDLTAEKFIADFIGVTNNPSARIYRSGDLGRMNEDGEVEYLGRIDTQVKIRGYRIELTEIESILLEYPGVAQAVVDTFESEQGDQELVAYYSLNSDCASVDHADMAACLRARLPAYMVPAYFEQLDIIPMTASNKADRKHLPRPSQPRLQTKQARTAAASETQRLVASALAETLKLGDVSTKDDFFRDLGGHSLLMARFCAAIRQRINAAGVSMRDVYECPTVEQLAARIDAQLHVRGTQDDRRARIHRAGALQYYGCGALQLLAYLALGGIYLCVLVLGAQWINQAMPETADVYWRSLVATTTLLVALTALPVVLKRHLVGKWRADTFPVWSMRYFGLWFMKLIYHASPAHLLIGTPAYNAWLRLLGARIGRDAVIMSKAPVTTDLFEVGENTIVRDGTMMQGYRADGGLIHTGAIRIGRDAYVGRGSHLDVNTTIEDGSQLGHSSTLIDGQTIPRNTRFHGTPGEQTATNFIRCGAKRCGGLRRWSYALAMLAAALVLIPLPVVFLFFSFSLLYSYSGAAALDYSNLAGVIWHLAPKGIWISATVFFGLTALALVSVQLLPRLFNQFLQPGRDYALFGFHYLMHQLVRRTSYWGYFNLLFGDSSYIVNFLEMVGWKIERGKETGSNYGLDQVHDNPFLCQVGQGTMVSDGLYMGNEEMSATSFRLMPVKLGKSNYLGNNVLMPSQGRTGDNVLIANKTMVPIDGPTRENTGLLGSPAFEIPRIVEQDRFGATQDDLANRAELISRKNRVNLRTMALVFFRDWMTSFVSIFVMFVAILYYSKYAMTAIAAGFAFNLAFVFVFFVVMERASLNFGRLRPCTVSMYDRYFLFHEAHWKYFAVPLSYLFHGTPMRNLITRALGVKLGKRVFDDGAHLYDKTLLQVGDFCTLNTGSVLTAHSLEEGVFKSDYIRLGNGCTVGPEAFVHYGVSLGDDASIGNNAFVMKGETVPAGQVWQGNPACLAASGSGQRAGVIAEIMEIPAAVRIEQRPRRKPGSRRPPAKTGRARAGTAKPRVARRPAAKKAVKRKTRPAPRKSA